MSRSVSPPGWDGQPNDPDPNEDLDYELIELRSVAARSGGEEHLLFLPEDEEMLRSEAFIVVDPAIVCDLDDKV